jgi:hypothetical protein
LRRYGGLGEPIEQAYTTLADLIDQLEALVEEGR